MMAVVFYIVFRTLFLTSTTGTVDSASERYASRGMQEVQYSYSVGGRGYHSVDTISDSYAVHSGMEVKVKYWRFWRSLSSLSEWSLPKRPGRTFGAEIFRLVLEVIFLPALAALIAAVTGLPMRRKKGAR